MAKLRQVDRERAIQRAMEYLYGSASDKEQFEGYGYDYLCSFHCIASTSRDPRLRATALRMGRERARYWRRQHPVLSSNADADDIAQFVFGSDAADRLGVRDTAIKSKVRDAASRFTARDYFWFDPATEPPPSDVPLDCDCGAENPRGRSSCSKCKKLLSKISRYEAWLLALVRSYIGERSRVTLGARYADVIKWLPAMRPYRGRQKGCNDEFDDVVYAVTHVVYTLNDYGYYNLSRRWLPNEFAFLRTNLKEAIKVKDPDMVGEFLDSLKAFGLDDKVPLISKAQEYLISCQNADGSWGDPHAEDLYQRYHPTWTAIDGLRDYAWRGERLSFPKLQPLLEQWADTGLQSKPRNSRAGRMRRTRRARLHGKRSV